MTKSSLRDQLTMTTQEAKFELTEQELSHVTGGGKKSEKPREFIKITMSDIIVSHY
jgi:bacteriocin-like protein